MKKLLLRVFLIITFIFLTCFITGIFAGSSALSEQGKSLVNNSGANLADISGVFLALSIAYGCYRFFEFLKSDVKKRPLLESSWLHD
ncbi:MAG: hypothetical protein ABSD71_09425 [Bacteroidales bacterium]|jgi:uncharacterized membrane protein (UPF0182 family)